MGNSNARGFSDDALLSRLISWSQLCRMCTISLACGASVWFLLRALPLCEAALQEQQGPDAVAQLTAKHLYCSLPVHLLKQLRVKSFLQMPGYAVLTYLHVISLVDWPKHVKFIFFFYLVSPPAPPCQCTMCW